MAVRMKVLANDDASWVEERKSCPEGPELPRLRCSDVVKGLGLEVQCGVTPSLLVCGRELKSRVFSSDSLREGMGWAVPAPLGPAED